MVKVTKHYPAPKQGGIAIREIVLYTTNDGTLYRQQAKSIIANLAKKKAKGVYNRALAVKGFVYLAESGIKKYKHEFDMVATFSASDKRSIAIHMLSHYQDEIDDEANDIKEKAKKKTVKKK